MLKQRLLTALILVPCVLLMILYANAWVLIGFVMLVLGLAASEWLALIPISSRKQQVFYCALLVLCMGLCFVTFTAWLVFGLLLWCAIIVAVLTYPRSARVWGRPWAVGLSGLILLPLAGVASIGLYQQMHGAELVIYVLALVVASDSGAYFVGKLYGKHALISCVSSGKTIEGAVGGLLFPLGFAWVAGLFWPPASWPIWFGLALMTAVISMFGDLSISMLKRRCHVKDTGALLPGHGGVLDRLDSIFAAIPWFYVGFYYLTPGL